MLNEIIELYTKEGIKKEYNLLLRIFDKDTKKTYIVYNEKNNKDVCYAAEYENILGKVKLNNNLSDIELKMIEHEMDKVKAK